MALIVTPGAVDANSYLTVEEADAFHQYRLFNNEWSSANEENKEKALAWATRILDARVLFVGYRYDFNRAPAGVSNTRQALEWPRFDAYDRDGLYIPTNVIPVEVKNATAELGWLLLRRDRTASRSDAPTAGFKSIALGPIRLGIDPTDRRVDIPESVIVLLKGLGVKKGTPSDGSSSGGCIVPLVRT